MSVGEGERWACDTSVAIAALEPNHQAHGACRRAVVDLRPALAGHAAFETYSVLTRLPPPLRLGAGQADAVLAKLFPEPCWLSASDLSHLRGRLAELGIVGGSVYDALCGQASHLDNRVLLTRDRRAERTYGSLAVRYRFVE